MVKQSSASVTARDDKASQLSRHEIHGAVRKRGGLPSAAGRQPHPRPTARPGGGPPPYRVSANGAGSWKSGGRRHRRPCAGHWRQPRECPDEYAATRDLTKVPALTRRATGMRFLLKRSCRFATSSKWHGSPDPWNRLRSTHGSGDPCHFGCGCVPRYAFLRPSTARVRLSREALLSGEDSVDAAEDFGPAGAGLG